MSFVSAEMIFPLFSFEIELIRLSSILPKTYDLYCSMADLI